LDKTIIARSSTLAFGVPFYRSGLIGRSDMLRSVFAQLIFRFAGAGAGHGRMERIRAHVSALCRGWPVDQVREIVAANRGWPVIGFRLGQPRPRRHAGEAGA